MQHMENISVLCEYNHPTFLEWLIFVKEETCDASHYASLCFPRSSLENEAYAKIFFCMQLRFFSGGRGIPWTRYLLKDTMDTMEKVLINDTF